MNWTGETRVPSLFLTRSIMHKYFSCVEGILIKSRSEDILRNQDGISTQLNFFTSSNIHCDIKNGTITSTLFIFVTKKWLDIERSGVKVSLL